MSDPLEKRIIAALQRCDTCEAAPFVDACWESLPPCPVGVLIKLMNRGAFVIEDCKSSDHTIGCSPCGNTGKRVVFYFGGLSDPDKTCPQDPYQRECGSYCDECPWEKDDD